MSRERAFAYRKASLRLHHPKATDTTGATFIDVLCANALTLPGDRCGGGAAEPASTPGSTASSRLRDADDDRARLPLLHPGRRARLLPGRARVRSLGRLPRQRRPRPHYHQDTRRDMVRRFARRASRASQRARDRPQHVIPARASYLMPTDAGPDRVADASPLPLATTHASPLVRGGSHEDSLLPFLLDHLDHARRADILASFILESGVELLFEHLRDLVDSKRSKGRQGRVRILTGDYLGITGLPRRSLGEGGRSCASSISRKKRPIDSTSASSSPEARAFTPKPIFSTEASLRTATAWRMSEARTSAARHSKKASNGTTASSRRLQPPPTPTDSTRWSKHSSASSTILRPSPSTRSGSSAIATSARKSASSPSACLPSHPGKSPRAPRHPEGGPRSPRANTRRRQRLWPRRARHRSR